VCRDLLGDKSCVLAAASLPQKKDYPFTSSTTLTIDGSMISVRDVSPTSFVRVGFSTTNVKHVIGHQDACLPSASSAHALDLYAAKFTAEFSACLCKCSE
jgi:hypothetical protein